MQKLTRGIAAASARHPWRTLTSWLAVIAAIFFLAIAAGGTFVDDFSSPGSQSAQAVELLDQNFPDAAKGSAMVVLHADDGTTLADHRAEIAQVLDDVSAAAHVESVAEPFAAGTISADGRIGFAVLTLDSPEREIGKPAFAVLSDAVSGMGAPGLQVELGGDAIFLNAAEENSSHTAIGLLVALLVLLVVFGTVVAAIVPIGLSLVAVGASVGGIMLMASTMNVSVSAIAVAGLVGLGVGVDYALFVVARYRENRSAGQDNTRALSNAMATSGTAVVFAGGTVMVATAALGITGLGILTSIGLATALMVFSAVAAAVTLLPAILTLLGDRIDAGRIDASRVVRRHRPALRTEDSAWWRFGHHVSRRPWPYLLGAVALLAALAAPALAIQTAFPAAGDAPAHTTHRQAYDLLTEGFGIGFNAPLTVVMDLDSSTAGADGVASVQATIADVPGIVSVGDPQTSADGSTVVFSALPDGGPADAETSATIERVRDVIPDNTYVTGITAITDDLNSQLEETLPLFIGAVIGISFLLLMLVFRSVAVPLKAAVMNVLSIGVAYGVLVMVFQWGWGAELLGLDGPTPITSIIVVIMFPIVFGLSMDYEVFLLSRIREEYAATRDNAESVARGLASTGRIITSAALIMIAVFLSFVSSPVPSVKMLGLGLATAIAVDATVVRMVLVPATMSLLGDANWWLPRWLDRLLPVVEVEAPAAVTATPDVQQVAPREEELIPQ
ncbi:putative drug exporter of the RND superfamily [Nocardioides alpinus]|uniref:MMPL family transporter n=1 Tax=Nocardioides alpinus TaxID=748909 RepID=A0A1I1AZ19_9ACTN|nr:MMPL family transporter [Nocardioides alpinus]PKH40886.1 MMPL family transporter [Nocardioides alpinus]SFB41610.1 putative drug exporter of the RND superfamily [Nocardioides alpinus]